MDVGYFEFVVSLGFFGFRIGVRAEGMFRIPDVPRLMVEKGGRGFRGFLVKGGEIGDRGFLGVGFGVKKGFMGGEISWCWLQEKMKARSWA